MPGGIKLKNIAVILLDLGPHMSQMFRTIILNLFGIITSYK